jgi:glyoxylase-like metal-dependent hydrolase (beta-lactamase superfamily II)
MLRQLASDVFRLSDGCNVYLLKSGSKGLLIDIGGGEVLRCMKQAGIERIGMALLTHAHRDQCRALPALLAHGAIVAAPQAEKPYFGKEEVRRFWKEHYPLANSTTYYSVMTEGYDEVDCRLVPGDVIEWEGFTLEAVDAKGHTPGQLAYLLKRDDGDILFCGDALYEGGKMWKGYTLDWDHWTAVGVEAAIGTLERWRGMEPAVMAPSHGEVIDQHVRVHIEKAIERLQAYGLNKSFEYFSVAAGGKSFSERVPVLSSFTAAGVTAHQLSQHLWIQDNSYFLISDTKQCLMIDCGYVYYEEFIPDFLRMADCTSIEVVIPTHAHDDHAGHLNVVKKRYGAAIWVLDTIQDVIEAPWRYWQPWSRWKDNQIDRVCADGETVQWYEYALTFYRFPGQTAFGSAVQTVVDGRHILFAGDNFFPVEQWNGTGGVMGLNRGLPPGYAYSAAKVLEIRPEWVLAAHEGPFLFDEEEFRNRASWAAEVERCMKELAPAAGGGWQAHHDPHALSVYPFMCEGRGGEWMGVRLTGEEGIWGGLEKNWLWELPAGFEVREMSGDDSGQAFQIRIPDDTPSGQYAIYVQPKNNPVPETFCIVNVLPLSPTL